MEEPDHAFRHSLTVQPSDIDALGHVNNVVYVKWVQDVAAAHWVSAASAELRSKYLWVVLRHEIDYLHPAFPGDDIVGFTWVGKHYGARFERFVKLVLAKNNKALAEARTMWCMLDSQSMRPARINEAVLRILPSAG